MKKNIWKRLLSLALALVMVAGWLPRFAVEANAATATHGNSGIMLEVTKVYCKECAQVSSNYTKNCDKVTIESVSLSGKNLTIVASVTSINHFVGNGDYHVATDKLTITCSSFDCNTNYSKAKMASGGWKYRSENGGGYGTTYIYVSRSAGHKTTGWTSNNNGKHSGNCALCGAVEESCKLSEANCTTPATCSVCKYVSGTTNDNHSYGGWVQNADGITHTRICTLDSAHTETEDCSVGTNGTDATCTEKAKCGTCGAAFGAEPQGHSWTYEMDGANQVKAICKNTGICPLNNDGGYVKIAAAETNTYSNAAVIAQVSNNLKEDANTATTIGTVSYSPKDGSTLTDGKAVNVGSYTASVNVGTATICTEFEITPKSISGAGITFTPESVTYPDSTEAPAVIVKDGEKVLTEGTDYDLGWNEGAQWVTPATNTVTVTGKGNYKDSVDKSFTINSGTLPGTISAENVEKEYDGTSYSITVTGVPDGATVTYSTDGLTYTVNNPAIVNVNDSGTVYYKVSKEHYEDFEGSAAVTIRKAEAPDITFPEVLNAITYGQKLEEAKLSSYANDYGIFNWNAPTSVPKAGTAGYALDFYPNALALQNYDWKNVGEAQWIADRNALCICPNVTVNKAAAAITTDPTPNDLTYNGEDQPLVTAGSVTGGTMVYSLEKEGTYTADLPQAMDVDTYTVWYQVEADSNHTASAAPASVTVEIKKANASVDVAPTAIAVYNGREQCLITSTYSMGGTVLYSLDGINYTESLPMAVNAQEYTVYYKVVGDANHNDMEPKTVTAKIAPWNIETASCKAGVRGGPFTYNGQEHTPTPQIDVWVDNYPVPGKPYEPGADVRLTEGTDYTVTYSNNVNAGEAVVTFTGKGNYTGTITKKFTIDPKPITVTIADKTSVYGEAVAELTATDDGIVNNDTNVYSLATTATSTANAGTYPITGTTLNNNYKITFVGGTYTITKATNQWTTEPSITGWTYGETASTPSGKAKFGDVTVTYAGKGTENFTAEAPTQAGDYTAKFTVTGNDNYNGLEETRDFTIAKKALAVTEAVATGREYNGTKTVAITAVTLDGIVGEDTVAVDLTDLTGTLESANKGTYTSVTLPELKLKDDKGNYTLTQPTAAVKTNVEITAKPITVTVADIADQTWTGSTLTPAVVSPTGLVKETDEYCTVTYTDNTNVGLATVNVEEKGNYTFTAIEKTFLIVPDELLIANLTTENVTSANKANVDKAVQMMNNADLNDAPAEDKAAWETLKTLANDLQDQLEAADAADETQNIQDVEGINAGNVKLDQKQDLKDALKDLESAKENYYGSYTAEEKAALDADIKRVEDALAAIERVEDFNTAIDDPLLKEDVTTDMDAATEEAIKDAQDAYNALSDYEKTLVDPADKTRLGKLVATITDYKVAKGDGGRYTVGSGKTLSFTANGPVRKFDYVQVNGKTIASSNYTVTEGSTIITLKSSYLDKLGYGKHKIQIFYTDGSTDVANFRIYMNGGNPFTGDNTHMLFFAGIMMTSLLCMGMMVMFVPKKKGKYQR